ncbi:MAG TPA: type II toxin-antitoxin system VapB family antitoxin [Terriglobia bacterium]|nr:type II toxin-antitoxin system VapB family antitoxin [Terriglobia bacterium]
MALSIKSPETEHLVRELAKEAGENITEAVRKSVQERLDRIRNRRHPMRLADQLEAIAKRCAALPIIDTQGEDAILDYGREGLPSCDH